MVLDIMANTKLGPVRGWITENAVKQQRLA
jgi:hypothetical protein